ncbi:MAG: hypothetical protein JSV30_00225 [Candidatus Omnitrophota bacterium]|nr:MAG: hypothetical protein JSV30_00225 [Candidatus Omnitrophota bacterium]
MDAKQIQGSTLPRILVYGIERFDLSIPQSTIKTKNFEIDFEPFETAKRFQDYNGVVLFQSTFESVESTDGLYAQKYLRYRRDELVKRRNQTLQLRERGGFICFLIHSEFVDYIRGQDDLNLKQTGLCKLLLNYDGFYRYPLGGDCGITKTYKGEFLQFLKDYGIAKVKFSYNSFFEPYVKKICDAGYRTLAGFILFDSHYIIPCRIPSIDEIDHFFKELVSSLVATSKKLVQEIPSWVDDYKFQEEEAILKKEVALQNKIEALLAGKEVYKKYKRCLCYSDNPLVDSVVDVLKEGFSFNIDTKKDEYIEDRAILDKDNKEIALLEIKGVNENIKSPNVYQADSHRGRRGKSSKFPTILIVNSFIKSANSIADKLREVNSEQVKLAVEKKVLIMRTIDLLNLLYLKEQGEITNNDVLDIFTKKYGWLRVSKEGCKIEQ